LRTEIYGYEVAKATYHRALPAFSTSLGSPSYGITYSVTVLKKSTELVVGGVTSKL
jgi:hypothetical protein